jgi:hypothetical protein
MDGHSFAHPEQALTAGGRRGLARPGIDDLQIDVCINVTDRRGGSVCKAVGSAYVGSKPTPATTCENTM